MKFKKIISFFVLFVLFFLFFLFFVSFALGIKSLSRNHPRHSEELFLKSMLLVVRTVI